MYFVEKGHKFDPKHWFSSNRGKNDYSWQGREKYRRSASSLNNRHNYALVPPLGERCSHSEEKLKLDALLLWVQAIQWYHGEKCPPGLGSMQTSTVWFRQSKVFNYSFNILGNTVVNTKSSRHPLKVSQASSNGKESHLVCVVPAPSFWSLSAKPYRSLKNTNTCAHVRGMFMCNIHYIILATDNVETICSRWENLWSTPGNRMHVKVSKIRFSEDWIQVYDKNHHCRRYNCQRNCSKWFAGFCYTPEQRSSSQISRLCRKILPNSISWRFFLGRRWLSFNPWCSAFLVKQVLVKSSSSGTAKWRGKFPAGHKR